MNPVPPTLTAADDHLLAEVAAWIQRKQLAAPVVLWLEGVRPLSRLGAQALHFLNPFVQVFLPTETFSRLVEIIGEPAHLDRLLQHLEAPGNGSAAVREVGS